MKQAWSKQDPETLKFKSDQVNQVENINTGSKLSIRT